MNRQTDNNHARPLFKYGRLKRGRKKEAKREGKGQGIDFYFTHAQSKPGRRFAKTSPDHRLKGMSDERQSRLTFVGVV